jgi:phosphatidylglycerophosphatase A|tara:strand:+ start:309 stop:803 length:495 start_codon:yes stop_codon:yes gene_type:complete
MIKKINISILSMFSVGYSKYAPGTVASFITCLIFILLYIFQINILFLIGAVSLIFIYSVYAIDKSVNYFDTIDAKEIVVDEFIGQSIPILTFYNYIQVNNFGDFILLVLLSFFLFRIFDITKPYPINKIDRNMKNGFGVILDDVVAGIYSSVVLLIIFSFIYYE